MTVNPITKKAKRKDHVRIYLDVHYNGERLAKSCGITIHKNDWDKRKKEVKRGHPLSDVHNLKIATLTRKILLTHASSMDMEQKPSIKALLSNALDSKKVRPKSIIDGAKDFYEFKRNSLKNKASAARYKTLVDQLEGMQLVRSSSYLGWDAVNEKFMYAFIQYLDDGGCFGKEPLTLSYISAMVDTMKMFLRWARSRSWHNDSGFETVSLKTHKKQDFVLDMEQILVLWELDLSEMPVFDKVRDEFVFSWFTGIRWSDIDKAKQMSVIKQEINGVEIPVWHYVSKKTKTQVAVGLSDIAYEIYLKRHSNMKPTPTSTTSRVLKELGKLAGFTQKVVKTTYKLNGVIQEEKEMWELMHFHQGRKGFVTNMINSGMSSAETAKLAGMTIQNIESYYVKSDEAIFKQVNILNQKQ